MFYQVSAYDQRLNELIKTIDQVTFLQLDKRLLDYVHKRAAIHRDQTIHTTHQQIAADLNVSREAVSRLLKNLERQGKLQLGRNQVTIVQA